MWEHFVVEFRVVSNKIRRITSNQFFWPSPHCCRNALVSTDFRLAQLCDTKTTIQSLTSHVFSELCQRIISGVRVYFQSCLSVSLTTGVIMWPPPMDLFKLVRFGDTPPPLAALASSTTRPISKRAVAPGLKGLLVWIDLGAYLPNTFFDAPSFYSDYRKWNPFASWNINNGRNEFLLYCDFVNLS